MELSSKRARLGLTLAACVALPTLVGSGLAFAVVEWHQHAEQGIVEAVLASTLVAGCLGLAMSMVLARRLARPIEEMASVARAFAAGDLAKRADGYRGELGELALELNAMGASLEHTLALKEAERQRLAIVLAGMAEGVLAVDGDERLILVNDAARAFLGGSGSTAAASLIGVELSRASRVPELHDLVSKARTGKRHSIELQLAREGLVKHIRVSAAPLAVGGGKSGALVVLADMTAVRRLEALRRDFVANVSHELKTPLTSVVGYTETLLDGALGDVEHSRRFVEKIAENAARLLRLVEDLLALARLENEESSVDLEPLDLSSAIEAALQRFAERASAKKIALVAQVELAPGTRHALADDEALRQALDNLIDNALKYTSEGGHVTVRARVEGDRLVVLVEDDGAGIPGDSLARIFERFYRVDKARSRAIGGTGLGLAIVKHAVLSMGGAVSVTSQLGRGSTFRIELGRPAPEVAAPATHR
jgi:two-component system, OmpR family, phosphate regulon sensor histidine kinase PhoR